MLRISKYLYFNAVMLITSWLPDLIPILRLRGFLLRPAFKSCGANLQVARHVTVAYSSRIVIGRDVFLGYSTWLHGSAGIAIEDEAQFGPFSIAITGNHGLSGGSYRWARGKNAPIQIGRGAWIAAHAVITGGVRIGSGSLVAAGSVVTRDVPDLSIVGGVPAQLLREHAQAVPNYEPGVDA